MKWGRWIAGVAVVALVGAGGMFALAPDLYGQTKRTIVAAGPDGFATLTGGGSRIGVSVRDLEASDVTKHKLSGPAGAVVEQVDSETPAAKAGVKAGDIVVGFDGERVRSARQLDRLVEETPPGRTVKLSVMRDGAKLDLDVTPEASTFAFGPGFRGNVTPSSREWAGRLREDLREELRGKLRQRELDRFRAPAFEFDWDESGMFALRHGRLGVSGNELSDQLASYFGVQSGVLVSNVAESSPAAKAGVKAGDIITAVNGKTVTDMSELRHAIVEAGEGKEITLTITRDKKPLTLKATIERPEEVRPRARRIV